MITVDGQRKVEPAVLSLPRDRRLPLSSTPLVMGVLNVTPDSFSDGGRWLDPKRAVEHGLELFARGAHLLDVGAESTRPGGGVYGDGAPEVSAGEECDRLLPVIEGLRQATDAPLSIDTRKAAVARQALAAGGDVVNDVSSLEDPQMAEVAAAAGAPLVVMHSRGPLATMQQGIHFDDLIPEVRAELGATTRRARAAGMRPSQILVDPGVGFGKRVEHNLELLARLGEIAELGHPVVVGASRKSFIGDVTGAAVEDRLPGSLAAVGAVAAIPAGTTAGTIVRVHDVAETVQFLEVWQAVAAARSAKGQAA